ncbi:glycosyltransferase [Phaeobacter sp. PT47_59]|uniref:glycosyltransferase family 2 protein n=1 Tax=Phaeobacter sp. PT47_59 TaxID=3029979 RepID=UPI00237FD87D|nr:glycosyltransferase [Phaeobacter sp. PT47_59]MDE4175208.1 glycosyltransferase [Phaeobacter sp. PT47_59]
MKLSIVIIFHNMRREATRSLFSLSPTYQQAATEDDYEVIAIDNGSQSPLDPETVTRQGPNFRYYFHDTTSISPVEAMNLGAEMARGKNLAFIVDGARMASPGLISASLQALRLAQAPFISSLSWHLGPDVQNKSMLAGYNQTVEDELIERIGWPEDGYRLFEISTIAQSSRPGFLGGMPAECSWLVLPRSVFQQIGGYDPGFQTGGGGLVNHDFRNRVLQVSGIYPVVLLGEGVFHQFHGGVATNIPLKDHPIHLFKEEYKRLRGTDYSPFPCPNVRYFGHFPTTARQFLAN